MSFATLSIDRPRDYVMLVTLNRPDQLNAYNVFVGDPGYFERDRARRGLRNQFWLLRQIEDARSLAPVDNACVGRLEPREDTKERRLAAAVDAEQPYAIPFLDRHGHIREESLGAVGLGQ